MMNYQQFITELLCLSVTESLFILSFLSTVLFSEAHKKKLTKGIENHHKYGNKNEWDREKEIGSYTKDSSRIRLNYTILTVGASFSLVFARDVFETFWQVLLLGFIPIPLVLLGYSAWNGLFVSNSIVGAWSKGVEIMNDKYVQYFWSAQETFFRYGFISMVLFIILLIFSLIPRDGFGADTDNLKGDYRQVLREEIDGALDKWIIDINEMTHFDVSISGERALRESIVENSFEYIDNNPQAYITWLLGDDAERLFNHDFLVDNHGVDSQEYLDELNNKVYLSTINEMVRNIYFSMFSHVVSTEGLEYGTVHIEASDLNDELQFSECGVPPFSKSYCHDRGGPRFTE